MAPITAAKAVGQARDTARDTGLVMGQTTGKVPALDTHPTTGARVVTGQTTVAATVAMHRTTTGRARCRGQAAATAGSLRIREHRRRRPAAAVTAPIGVLRLGAIAWPTL